MREVTVSFSGSENVIDKIKRENALRVSRGQISFAKGSNNKELEEAIVELKTLKSDNETIMKDKVKLEGDVKILDEKLAAKEAKLKLLDKELKDTKKLITK